MPASSHGGQGLSFSQLKDAVAKGENGLVEESPLMRWEKEAFYNGPWHHVGVL